MPVTGQENQSAAPIIQANGRRGVYNPFEYLQEVANMKSVAAQFLSVAMSASLLISPIALAGHGGNPGQAAGQSTTQSQSPALAQGQTSTQSQNQAPAPSQDSTSNQTQGQTSPSASSQSNSPEPGSSVKPGSEADVNAIGNRGVGKGINFYSLQKRNRAGQEPGAAGGSNLEIRHRPASGGVRESRGAEFGAQFRRASAVHDQGD